MSKQTTEPPPPVVPPPPAVAADLPSAEIARLRAENEALRKRLAQDGPGLSRDAGPRQKYRVKLPSVRHGDGRVTYVKVRQSTRTVGPRKPMAGQPPLPEKFRKMPYTPYDTAALLVDGRDVDAAAWQRYAEANKLDHEGDREYFKIRAHLGPVTDYLDVEAVSPADAFDHYKRYQGILNTMQAPEVVALPA